MDTSSLYVYILPLTWIGLPLLFAWYMIWGWKRKFPLTLQQYIDKHPSAKTKTGIACAMCGSKSLRNLGVKRASDSRRLVSCNSCSTALYHAKQ